LSAARLRDYQVRLADEAISRTSKGGAIIVQSATGSGKTTTAAEIAARKARSGWVLYVVPRDEIHGQTVRTVGQRVRDVESLTSGADLRWPTRGVMVAMGLTLQSRLRQGAKPPRAPVAVVVDEAHYGPAVAATLRKMWPHVPMIGLSATPVRLNDYKLAGIYTEGIVAGPQYRDLVAGGYLVPIRTLTAHAPDLRGVRVIGGDWDAGGLGRAFSAVVGDAVAMWRQHASGRRTLTFAATREHGQQLLSRYKAAGIRAAYVDGETPADKRAAALLALRRHAIDVLVNVALFVEGLDIPEIDCIQWHTATRSLAKFLQGTGRGTRRAPGKRDLLVLDHGGNVDVHGLPDDDREWVLDDDPPAKGSAPLRTCRMCGATIRVACARCHPPVRGIPAVVHGSLREAVPKRAPLSVAVMPTPPRPCPPQLMVWRQVWDRLEAERYARRGDPRVVDEMMRVYCGR